MCLIPSGVELPLSGSIQFLGGSTTRELLLYPDKSMQQKLIVRASLEVLTPLLVNVVGYIAMALVGELLPELMAPVLPIAVVLPVPPQ